MKLYVQTERGIGIGIDVLLTGQVKMERGRIEYVEVALPSGCDGDIVFHYKPLPKTPGGRPLLWVGAYDLRTDSGFHMKDDAVLLDEIKSVNDRRAEEMRQGPLGENWP